MLYPLLFIGSLGAQIQGGINIKGVAVDSIGILLEDKLAVLKDSTNKILYRTKTSSLFLKRYGGGKFQFKNVIPGEYTLEIATGAPLKIIRMIQVQEKNIDLGTLRPRRLIPHYTLPEISDSLLILMRPIPTEFMSEDTINIQHILIDLKGESLVGRVDSITTDSLFYTTFNMESNRGLPLEKLYYAYNDYGYMIYKSRSLSVRMNELEKRDGFIITQKGDTLSYESISFENSMENPGVAIFKHGSQSPEFIPMLDVYMIKTGEGYIENSVRRGFWTGLGVLGGYIGYRMLREKSFSPLTSILPDPIVNPRGNQYQSMILTFPLLTLGWISYDYYFDKRANYILPRHNEDRFPTTMYIFSLPHWIGLKMSPILKPIKNSSIVKFFKNRKSKKGK